MYSSLGLALGRAGILAILPTVVEAFLTITYCGASVFYLISSLSNIPNTIKSSSAQFRDLYNRELLKVQMSKLDPLHMQCLLMLKSLSEIKPVYVTVWDMLKVERSLLLSSFGCTLTFGFLIMEMNRNEDK
ncbi:hypothetical protein HNY73_016185 [Argiope bruennichi]|uniref:Uncharacterized protein n=1 Tax=Argiope bruennichi TaxID=94029 RepID=A0A8T0EI54_ARGBR|nr:hypothetical protein HNY73_016185 [Argiope bruennichi]